MKQVIHSRLGRTALCTVIVLCIAAFAVLIGRSSGQGFDGRPDQRTLRVSNLYWANGSGGPTNYKLETEDYTSTTTVRAITAAESGTVFTVSEADGTSEAPVKFLLPAAAAGLHYWFVDNDAGEAADLTIDPNTGDSLNGDTAGDGIACTTDTAGQSIHYVALDATTWVPLHYIGTWTPE